MKSLSLIVSLILMVGYLTPVQAVTDAELEALEKQIEQLESEEKQQAEEKRKAGAAAKRKAEQKRKVNAEAEKKRLAELEKQRIEEEKHLLEETRLAEQERQRQKEEAKKQKVQEQTTETKANDCSIIIGVWRWNDLLRTISRFYEDGRVVFKNIFKSEGNWECVDPEKKRFTFNTGNKKKDIQIEDNYKKFHSVGLLGEKLNANKISDDPFEKIVPAKKSSSNVPRL